MRAGKLRTRVTIESVTETQDAMGHPVKSWSTFCTRWARVRRVPTSKRMEVYVAERFEAEADWIFTLSMDMDCPASSTSIVTQASMM